MLSLGKKRNKDQSPTMPIQVTVKEKQNREDHFSLILLDEMFDGVVSTNNG